MTRGTSAVPPVPDAPRPPGFLASGGLIAGGLSLLGLTIVAVLTLGLFTGRLPLLTGQGSGGSPVRGGGSQAGTGGDPGGDPNRTPAPSNVVIVDPRSDVPGSIVFAKQGNIWVQSGSDATQVTDTGRDSMASWSPDGTWIYFIETVSGAGLFPSQGAPRHYTLTYPILTRVHPDGSGREKITSGLYSPGGGALKWFYWLRQPVLSSDGHTIALLSDGPDPTKSDVVVQFYDMATRKLTRPPIPEEPPLGHQDVTWRPDGKQLLYVHNGRVGSRGAPAIYSYDPATKKTRALTGPGYEGPSFSPDGRWVAATRTGTFGTDVVILNAKTGAQMLRVTDDGRSWAPTWSPKGDSIAYLNISYQTVDLRMVELLGRGPNFTLGEQLNLTEYSGLDGASRPGWFIPADQLPPPTPSPAATAGSSGRPAASSGASVGASASP